MNRIERNGFSFLTLYNLSLGRIVFCVWGLLVIHYIFVFDVGISFPSLSKLFTPFLSGLPLFDKLEVYYAHDPITLEKARMFYFVNNGVFFLVIAIYLVNSLIGICSLYQHYKKTIPEHGKEITCKLQAELHRYFLGMPVGFLLTCAVVAKLIGLSELPEQGIGRGFIVFIGQFSVFIFVALIPSTVALFLYKFFQHKNNSKEFVP